MIGSRFMSGASVAGAVAACVLVPAGWLVVPEIRCILGLPTAEICPRGRGSRQTPEASHPTPHVINVVIGKFFPASPPAQNSPQQKPGTPTPGAVPIQMIRLLTDGDLAGKSHQELDLMRNEIYARHGRRFDRPELQRYFGKFDWYRPIYSPRDFDAHHQNRLNEIQRLNAELLLRYQQLGR